MSGGCHPSSSTLPLSNFRDGRSDLKNFFMDKCPKDVLTIKKLFWEKLSPFRRKTRKPVEGWQPPPPPSLLGHRRVKAIRFVRNWRCLLILHYLHGTVSYLQKCKKVTPLKLKRSLSICEWFDSLFEKWFLNPIWTGLFANLKRLRGRMPPPPPS